MESIEYIQMRFGNEDKSSAILILHNAEVYSTT